VSISKENIQFFTVHIFEHFLSKSEQCEKINSGCPVARAVSFSAGKFDSRDECRETLVAMPYQAASYVPSEVRQGCFSSASI